MAELKKAVRPDAGNRRPGFLRTVIRRTEFSTFIALVALCAFVSILSPYFLTVNNIFNVLRQATIIAVMGVAIGFVLISGSIDLSIGAVMGLSAVLVVKMVERGLPAWLIGLIAVVVCASLTSLNAIVVDAVDLPPFIVTLGMQNILRGAINLITQGLPQVVYTKNPILSLGGSYISVIPVSVIVMVAVIIAGQIFASKTQAGRNVFAIGSNMKAAKLSGIRVGRTSVMVFAISGALCALAGIMLVGYVEVAHANAGTGYELEGIAAAVIGGISFSGGEGTIVGVIIGAILMSVLKNSFVMLGISTYWQMIALGIVIIVSVAFDRLRKRTRT